MTTSIFPVPHQYPRKSYYERHYIYSLLTICTLCGCIFIILPIHTNLFSYAISKKLNDRNVGNSTFAQDIYGVGVRVGLYLQALSGILVTIRPLRQPGGATPIIFSTIICLSILGSWTKRAVSHDISPAESIVVFNMLLTNTSPAMIGTINAGVRGNVLGFFCWIILILWLQGAQLWFYPIGSSILPPLGTPGIAWFFVQVRIRSWYWKVLTASLSATTVVLLILTLNLMFGAVIPAAKWWIGDYQDDDLWVSFSFPNIYITS